MKIEGTTDIAAPRDRVWSGFLDPAVLSKAIPGCEELVSIGPDEYKAVMKDGLPLEQDHLTNNGAQQVRVILLDQNTNAVGSVTFPIK